MYKRAVNVLYEVGRMIPDNWVSIGSSNSESLFRYKFCPCYHALNLIVKSPVMVYSNSSVKTYIDWVLVVWLG